MSSATSQSSRIFSLSYSFALKWALKAKQLNDLKEASIISTIKSDVYQFKTAKNLRFYLEIEPSLIHRSMSVKGTRNWSFKLEHAILVSKDRVFCLNYVHKLRYLPMFDSSSIPDEEDITVQCVVTASSIQSDLSLKEEDPYLKEGGNTVGFEGIPDTTLPSDYENDMVIDFIQRGIIPDFYNYDKTSAISKAVQILVDMEKHKCEALKILCMQYLEDNIDADVLCQISRAALRSGQRELEIMCMELAASGVI